MCAYAHVHVRVYVHVYARFHEYAREHDVHVHVCECVHNLSCACAPRREPPYVVRAIFIPADIGHAHTHTYARMR